MKVCCMLLSLDSWTEQKGRAVSCALCLVLLVSNHSFIPSIPSIPHRHVTLYVSRYTLALIVETSQISLMPLAVTSYH